jgi:hypothetical protein
MFPFLLLLPTPVEGEKICFMLRKSFRIEWRVKPNTIFTPLKRSGIERATFQVFPRGEPHKGTSRKAARP